VLSRPREERISREDLRFLTAAGLLSASESEDVCGIRAPMAGIGLPATTRSGLLISPWSVFLPNARQHPRMNRSQHRGRGQSPRLPLRQRRAACRALRLCGIDPTIDELDGASFGPVSSSRPSTPKPSFAIESRPVRPIVQGIGGCAVLREGGSAGRSASLERFEAFRIPGDTSWCAFTDVPVGSAAVAGDPASAATLESRRRSPLTPRGRRFHDIQSALDAAADGDTVVAAPGEYVITKPIDFNKTGGISYDDRKNLTLRSDKVRQKRSFACPRRPWISPGETSSSSDRWNMTGPSGSKVSR